MSKLSDPLLEKRRYPRLGVSAPIHFRGISNPNEPFAGSLGRDLSAGGLRVTASRFIPKSARLVVQLSLPGLARPIRTIAQVMWVTRRRAMEAFDLGLKFIEIVSQDQKTLADYVDRGIVVR